MANYVSYANATELMTAIGQKFAALNGAYVVKGNSAFANLPSTLTAAMSGYVYNVTDDFTTDSRFVEGAGKDYPAGTNVVIVNLGDSTTPDMKFDVIGSFIDVDALEQAIADVSAMIASEFDTTASYTTGDLVTYEGDLYKFTADHAAGAWDAGDVDGVTVEELLAAIDTRITSANGRINSILALLAPAFSSATAYVQGDVVTYEDGLYVFVADHSAGDWSSSDVAAATVDSLIDAVNSSIGALNTRVNTIAGDLAPAFNSANAYAIGDVVVYQDVVYEFTSAHTAGDPWSSSEVTAKKLSELVSAAEPDELTTAQVNTLIGLLD